MYLSCLKFYHQDILIWTSRGGGFALELHAMRLSSLSPLCTVLISIGQAPYRIRLILYLAEGSAPDPAMRGNRDKSHHWLLRAIGLK